MPIVTNAERAEERILDGPIIASGDCDERMSYLSSSEAYDLWGPWFGAPRANAPTSVTFYYPQNRLKHHLENKKTENFFVPYRVVLKRDRTTDVAEPWRRTISRPDI